MQRVLGLILLAVVLSTVVNVLQNTPVRGSFQSGFQKGGIREASRSLVNTAVLPLRLLQLQVQSPEKEILVPVDGILVSDVTDTWGALRSGGRRHEGQDIFAERGTPIRPVVDGFVTVVANRGLGGKQVYVTGKGGRQYYYAHLDDFGDVSYGDKVTTETIIGFVGNTGNAISTPPHLHFGVYTGSGAINPMPLFKDRSD